MEITSRSRKLEAEKDNCEHKPIKSIRVKTQKNFKSWVKEESKKRDLDLREEAVEAARLEVVVNGVVSRGVAGGGGGGSSTTNTDHSTTTVRPIRPAASHNSKAGSNNRDNHLTASFSEEEEKEI